MIMTSYLMIAMLMLSNLLMLSASILSKKTFADREKSSPFECGFDPKSSARIPFSLQFFLIAIIFLIFDVEITLILPFILCPQMTSPASMTSTFLLLIMILLLGLFHEWKQGALTWNF